MPEQNEENKNTFDPTAFKQEIVNESRMLVESAVSNIQSKFEGLVEGLKSSQNSNPTPQKTNSSHGEYQAEIEALGLDDAQSTAILNLIDKAVTKKAPSKQEILAEVDENLSAKEQKNEYENMIKTYYPGFYDENSKLLMEARKEFNMMTKVARNQPDAAWNAVNRAASRMNIARATISNKNNFVEGSDGAGDGKKKMGEREKEFAAFFGINQDKYEAHRKLKIA